MTTTTNPNGCRFYFLPVTATYGWFHPAEVAHFGKFAGAVDVTGMGDAEFEAFVRERDGLASALALGAPVDDEAGLALCFANRLGFGLTWTLAQFDEFAADLNGPGPFLGAMFRRVDHENDAVVLSVVHAHVRGSSLIGPGPLCAESRARKAA